MNYVDRRRQDMRTLKLQPLTVKSNIKYRWEVIRQSDLQHYFNCVLQLWALINTSPGHQWRQVSIILDRTSCVLHTAGSPISADHCTVSDSMLSTTQHICLYRSAGLCQGKGSSECLSNHLQGGVLSCVWIPVKTLLLFPLIQQGW